MVAAVLARVLKLALHFAIVGSVVDVDSQVHAGQLREAVIHALVVSFCILVLAGAGYIATKLLNNLAPGDLRLTLNWAPKIDPDNANKRKPRGAKARAKASHKNQTEVG
jgi:hypothetical protein